MGGLGDGIGAASESPDSLRKSGPLFGKIQPSKVIPASGRIWGWSRGRRAGHFGDVTWARPHAPLPRLPLAPARRSFQRTMPHARLTCRLGQSLSTRIAGEQFAQSSPASVTMRQTRTIAPDAALVALRLQVVRPLGRGCRSRAPCRGQLRPCGKGPSGTGCPTHRKPWDT